VNLRQFISENFAGDLEYHPRRAAIYLLLGAASLTFWYFSPGDAKFTMIPLVFVLGSLTLAVKGVFMLRKSSEGLGLSDQELDALADPANRRSLPPLPAQAAQILQDFGAGSLLLWPLLNIGRDIDKSWADPPRFKVFAVGAVLFLLGWLIRKVTTPLPS
jgi:hypothetical protein